MQNHNEEHTNCLIGIKYGEYYFFLDFTGSEQTISVRNI